MLYLSRPVEKAYFGKIGLQIKIEGFCGFKISVWALYAECADLLLSLEPKRGIFVKIFFVTGFF